MAGGHPPSTYGGTGFEGGGEGRASWRSDWRCSRRRVPAAQDIEREPIRYSAATPRNAVSQLQERLAKGTAKLEFEPERGYLRSLLRALDVPESSQVLVFSKTSLQRERISPRTPRAIYFNDEVMVGFCNRGRVMEISAADDG